MEGKKEAAVESKQMRDFVELDGFPLCPPSSWPFLFFLDFFFFPSFLLWPMGLRKSTVNTVAGGWTVGSCELGAGIRR